MFSAFVPAARLAGPVVAACSLLALTPTLAQPQPPAARPGTASIASGSGVHLSHARRLGAPSVAMAASGAAGANAAVRPGSGLGLIEAVQTAARYHPAVRGAARQVLQADEGIAAARAGYYPQVRGGVGSQLSNRNISSYDSRRVNTASLSVSQMLYDFGKVDSAVGQAEAAVASTQAQVLLSVDDVARETALAWLELYRQQALAEIAQDQVRGVQALADLVNERERQGASSRSDVEQARSRVDAARAQLLDTQAQIRRWRISLMQLTGLGTVERIGDALPPVLETACVAQPDQPLPPTVRLAQAQRAEAAAAVRVAQTQSLPTLSLDGTVSHGLDARSRLPGEPGVVTTVGLNVLAPLYEGGANQARQRAAAHALGVADAAVDRARLVETQALEDARAQYQGQAQRLPVLASRVQSIRATRDLYRQQYLQLGTRSLLDLLNAEQEYHTVRFDQAASTHERYRLGLLCLNHADQLRTVFDLDVATGSMP